MKKLLSFLIVVVSLFTIACGGTNHKEEAQSLYQQHYLQTGSYLRGFSRLNSLFELNDDKFFSQESYNVKKDVHSKLALDYKNLEAKQVSKENIKLKEAMLKHLLLVKQAFAFVEEENYIYITQGEDAFDRYVNETRKNNPVHFKKMKELRYEVENEYSKVLTGKPVKIMQVNDKKVTAVTVSDVEFGLCSIETEKDIYINDYYHRKPLGKFLIVTVGIRNNQKDAVVIDSNLFKLIDYQNREFSVSTEGQTAVNMRDDNIKGFLTQLNPGMGTDFKFVFDVPTDSMAFDYVLSAKGGFSGKKIAIPLEVIDYNSK